MCEIHLLDITEVCRLLGVTSRALRFWEERGIISSTRHPFSKRRCYSAEQIGEIKRVIVLRSLGLSVAKIREYLSGNTDLSQVITLRRAELIAAIDTKARELRLLDEALMAVDGGGDIFAPISDGDSREECPHVAEKVVEEFISGNYAALFARFSEKMKAYAPLPALERIICDTVAPLGRFISVESITRDGDFPGAVLCRLRYEKLDLMMKLVLRGDTLHGFWMNYCEK